MIGSVSQSENAPKITLSDFTEPEELLDKDLDTRVIGMCACAINLRVLCDPNIQSTALISCSADSTRQECWGK
jgi:hypothetical protein